MKEATVSKGPKVTIKDSPVPSPGPGELLVKVVVSGSNPKDWKVPVWYDSDLNQGDDLAGTVVRVGEGVTEFRPGDRVAAMHVMQAPHGSYAEYAVAPAHTTFLLPPTLSFEAAATVPLAALTAALALHQELGLPTPWLPAKEATPLIVYGAGSAVGAFAVQLAAASNIHPIIAVAGASQAFVEGLLDKSKGDVVVDYRGGEAAAVAALQKAVGDKKVYHALDAISDHGSNYIAVQGLAKDDDNHKAIITGVLPWTEDARIPASLKHTQTYVGAVHETSVEFGYVYSRWLGRALQTGAFKAHPYEVVPGGLGGVQKGLTALYEGKAHGVKYVFRIAETEGAGQDVV